MSSISCMVAGNAGEFCTLRAVTQFIVDQVNPSLAKCESMLDPACGTGGFLTCVIENLLTTHQSKNMPASRHQRYSVFADFRALSRTSVVKH